jgi:hypothetical protein
MKRRVTLVVDDDILKYDYVAALQGARTRGVTVEFIEDIPVEFIEDIPDPDRVQEFRVRVMTKAADDPLPARVLDRALQFLPSRTLEYGVTEVAPTEVER